jgi:hypothetical protein
LALLYQALTAQPGWVAVNMACNHFAHDERIHIKPIEQRTDTWHLDCISYFGKERTVAACDCW